MLDFEFHGRVTDTGPLREHVQGAKMTSSSILRVVTVIQVWNDLSVVRSFFCMVVEMND